MSTVVVARPAVGKTIDFDDFTDLTDMPVEGVEWAPGGWLRVTFAGHLDDTEVAAVRRRIISAGAAEEALRAHLEAYLADPDAHAEEAVLVDVVRLALCLGTGDAPQ